jgi:GH24 family phage-related lysozyme (muramidase)
MAGETFGAGAIIDMPRLLARIKQEEGFRSRAYWDDAPGGGGGQWTWGYGTKAPGQGAVTDEVEASKELEIAVWEAVGDYQTVFPVDPVGCTAARKESLIDMVYNLGLTRFYGFAPTIDLIREGAWTRAAGRIRNSLWYRQVGRRARRVVRELETGNAGV